MRFFLPKPYTLNRVTFWERIVAWDAVSLSNVMFLDSRLQLALSL